MEMDTKEIIRRVRKAAPFATKKYVKKIKDRIAELEQELSNYKNNTNPTEQAQSDSTSPPLPH